MGLIALIQGSAATKRLIFESHALVVADLKQAIAEHVHQTCDAHFLNAWFERVNTSSNIADAPSRGVSCPELGFRFEISFNDVTEHAFESWGC